jgi:hypothetical protein
MPVSSFSRIPCYFLCNNSPHHIAIFFLSADISFPRTGMAGCRVTSPFFADQQLVVAGGLKADGTTISNQVDSLEISSGVWTTQVSR